MLSLHRLTASIDTYEKLQRQHLAGAFSSPYLGHYDLPKPYTVALGAYRREFRTQPFAAVERMFKRWPALTCILFARCVAEKMGETTGLEIYPHLAALIGVRDIPPNSRNDLSLWFRRACQTLGLPILHRLGHSQDNIREYLLQAGIPFAQIEDAASAFARTEASEGLPDADDDAACAVWCGVAADRVQPGQARLRFVLQEDASGYYADLWVLARTEPHALAGDPFGQRLVESANRLAAEIKSSVRPPRLVWCGNGMVFPPGQQATWTVDLGAGARTLRAADEETEVPLAAPWRDRIQWQRRDAKDQTLESHLTLLAGTESGVTVFDVRTGRLAAQVDTAKGAPLRLTPGHYVLVACRPLSCVGDTGFELLGGGYALDVALDVDEIRARVGTREIALLPWQRPSIELNGRVFTDLKGTTLYASQGLRALVRWPKDEMGNPHELIIECEALRLRHRFRVRPGEDQTAVVELRPLLDSRARVVRVALRLVREKEERAIARASGVVWCGLQNILAGRKFQGRVPSNYCHERSSHVVVSDDGLSLERDAPFTTATAVFTDIDGGKTNLSFYIPQPEPRALIEWFGEDGARQQRPLKTSDTITVAPGSERSLLVFCSDPTASLRVGVRDERRAFECAPRRRLPVAAFNDLCQGDTSAVSLVQTEPFELTLLAFPVARLCTPSRWRFNRRGLALRLDLAFERPLAALHISGVDILTGGAVDFEVRPDGLNVSCGSSAKARLEQCHDAASNGYQLIVERLGWPDGAWLLDLSARFEESSCWRPLKNMRLDAFTLALYIRDGDWCRDIAAAIPRRAEVDVFGRCHSALLRCYAGRLLGRYQADRSPLAQARAPSF